MQNSTFKALVVREMSEGVFSHEVEERPLGSLPDHEVLIKVSYSALNYKDALSATGNKGVTRSYPHTPGIDASGVVAVSDHPGFQVGDPVLITGHDLGMNTPGGLGEFIRVPSHWIIPLPIGLTLREAAALGTAGLTAGMALMYMERGGQRPASGPVLVTGATGGVGSMAVSILSQAGYEVIAATGKADATPYLQRLGAKEVIDRQAILSQKNRPLLSGRWAGVIDTVGGEILSAAIRSCMPYGNVAICGMVNSSDFSANVFPFILRGISLAGVESATCPTGIRWQVWQKLSRNWKPKALDVMIIDAQLHEAPGWITRLLNGQVRGRVVVSLSTKS